MLSQTPIHCPKCNTLVAYAENLTGLVLTPPGLVCPCGQIVVHSTTVWC